MISRTAAAAICLATAVTLGAAASAQTAIGQLSTRGGVEIAGAVTEVFGNRFVVDDGTGSVLVETGPRWHRAVDMTVGEQVRVRGEPDDGGFDAFEIIRAGGEALTIRPESGPPPWAGGRRD